MELILGNEEDDIVQGESKLILNTLPFEIDDPQEEESVELSLGDEVYAILKADFITESALEGFLDRCSSGITEVPLKVLLTKDGSPESMGNIFLSMEAILYCKLYKFNLILHLGEDEEPIDLLALDSIYNLLGIRGNTFADRQVS
jgi:hypothetical protein